MSRASRYFPGGMVYHVLNRGVGRRTLFHKDQDFLAFERVVEETLRTCAMRICAFSMLSNHWHFVLWPESDGDLPAFMQQMTNMHVKRWQEYRRELISIRGATNVFRWRRRTISTGSGGMPCG